MTSCSDERPCTPCYTDQGICDQRKQDFLDGLNDLSKSTGLHIFVDQGTNEICFGENPKDCLYKAFRYVGESSQHIAFDYH